MKRRLLQNPFVNESLYSSRPFHCAIRHRTHFVSICGCSTLQFTSIGRIHLRHSQWSLFVIDVQFIYQSVATNDCCVISRNREFRATSTIKKNLLKINSLFVVEFMLGRADSPWSHGEKRESGRQLIYSQIGKLEQEWIIWHFLVRWPTR